MVDILVCFPGVNSLSAPEDTFEDSEERLMHESEKRTRQQPKQVSCPADDLQRSERNQLQVAASLPSIVWILRDGYCAR